MHHLGNFSLMAVVVLCGYAVLASLVGAGKRSSALVNSARRALIAAAGFSALSVISLGALFLADAFRF